MKIDKRKRLLVLLLCIAMVGTALLAACSKEEEEEAEPPAPPSNALTGAIAEEGYDESASDRRVVGFVVENTPDARPQWGMDDENYSPDIVVQGEVEGGITRMLWLYADYKKLPEIIGPTRSARPPFIKFSKFFDAVFVHWGQSHSKDDYIGANTIFKWYKVDHINQMTLDDKEGLYGRDNTRYVNVEHRGIIYPDKLEATMANEGIRTTPNEFTKLYFNEITQPVSEEPATSVTVKYSMEAYEPTTWTYNEEDGMYHTSDFDNDFARENLLVLLDDTEYVTKYGYQGPGGASAVTYCNYDLAGGKALLFSKGTVKEIEWDSDLTHLILKDPAIDVETALAANEEAKAAAKENAVEGEDPAPYNKYYIVMPEEEEEDAEAAEGEAAEAAETEEAAEAEEAAGEEDPYAGAYVAQNLNKGKSWIGWISKNNGGSVTYN